MARKKSSHHKILIAGVLASPVLLLGGAVVLIFVVLIAALGLGGTPSSGSHPPSGTSPGGTLLSEPLGQTPSTLALKEIPPSFLAILEQAAVSNGICKFSWTVLAGVASVESDFGLSTLPGVHSGANFAGAMGPMQFEPATFAAYDTPVPPGGVNPPSPYDPVDAIYAAARLFCSNGVNTDLSQAIFDYNHSYAYVAQVEAAAASFASTSSNISVTIANTAATYLGVPYVWGGSSPSTGFDCSGLAQWVYGAAGIAIPRTATAQYLAGPPVPASSIVPGDLVFFGLVANPEPPYAEHVGIYIGHDEMVDAPHTGAVVRVDHFDPVLGVNWGGLYFIGATAPWQVA
ncbi:MAG: C40 family peptidase [Acidimicrobiales bacterium]